LKPGSIVNVEGMTTPTTSPAAPNHHADHPGFDGLKGQVFAWIMTIGRKQDAELAARCIGLTSTDHLVDIGCGPGVAVEHAASVASRATGVDPSTPMVRTARRRLRAAANADVLEGGAERLPLADASVTAAWSLASVHHWPDVTGGLREVRRILQPGGRFLAVERRTRPGATGLASHGWTDEQAETFAALRRDAGFVDVVVSRQPGSRRHKDGRLAVLARVPAY
jgi:ubiquinone/menaquinone biosynthesis C-methylase UbiE